MIQLLDVEVCLKEIAVNIRALNEGETIGWAGDPVEWQYGSLAATTPPPQVSLSREYIEDNDLNVDLMYFLQVLWTLGVEQGYRVGAADKTRPDRLAADELSFQALLTGGLLSNIADATDGARVREVASKLTEARMDYDRERREL